jgi:hypothetical protein
MRLRSSFLSTSPICYFSSRQSIAPCEVAPDIASAIGPLSFRASNEGIARLCSLCLVNMPGVFNTDVHPVHGLNPSCEVHDEIGSSGLPKC